MQELNGSTLIKRNEAKYLASPLGEEIVMMNTDNGDYLGVNSVGSDVWNLLGEPASVDVVINSMLDIYEVDAEQGRVEMHAFLQRMLTHEMIVIEQ